MVWFKVDDTLAAHPKARAAGLAAMGLWVVAGSYCGQQLTDGQVPDWYVTSWPGGRKLAAQLVAARLWHRPGHDCEECPQIDEGYLFHEYGNHNPSRHEVIIERQRLSETRAKAGRAGGIASGIARRNGQAKPKQTAEQAEANGEASAGSPASYETKPRPDPTRSASMVELGGSVTNPDVRDQNPPKAPGRRCERHASLPPGRPVPDCGACADARKAADAWTPSTPADRPAGELLAAMPELDPDLAAAGRAAARAAIPRRERQEAAS